MDVVAADDFGRGALRVATLGDARLVHGDATNATFLAHLFQRFAVDVVYHLPDPPSAAAALGPAADVYTSTLARPRPSHQRHTQGAAQSAAMSDGQTSNCFVW